MKTFLSSFDDISKLLLSVFFKCIKIYQIIIIKIEKIDIIGKYNDLKVLDKNFIFIKYRNFNQFVLTQKLTEKLIQVLKCTSFLNTISLQYYLNSLYILSN